jgi:hypothetical protein
MRRLSVVLALLVLLSYAGRAEAQTSCARATTVCTAASGNAKDVQKSINSAADGDTVIIPSGTWTWTSEAVTIRGKGIHLRGALTGQTTIRNAGGRNGPTIMRITEDTTHSVEVSHLTWLENSGDGGGDWYVMEVFSGGTNGKPVLLHDNSCTGPACTRFVRFFVNRGVIYRNTWVSTAGNVYNNRQFFSCRGGSSDASWNQAAIYGTADSTGLGMVYVENNFIDSISEMADFDDGCRVVWRFNRSFSGRIGNHGKDTSVWGCRHAEIYDNVILVKAGNTNADGLVRFRGCSAVVTDNVIQQVTYGAQQTTWAMIHTLQENVRGKWKCWGSPLNPIHGTAGTNTWQRNPGETYPAPHQIGWGRNATGTADAVEGIWFWSNADEKDAETGISSWSGVDTDMGGIRDFGGTGCGSEKKDTTAAYFVKDRDYFMGTAKPGYTKCVNQPTLGCNYPHPYRHDAERAARSAVAESERR